MARALIPGGIDPWGPEVCPKCQGAKTQRITRNYLAEAFQIAANPDSIRDPRDPYFPAFFLALAHLALTAFRPCSLSSSLVSFFLRALPPRAPCFLKNSSASAGRLSFLSAIPPKHTKPVSILQRTLDFIRSPYV